MVIGWSDSIGALIAFARLHPLKELETALHVELDEDASEVRFHRVD